MSPAAPQPITDRVQPMIALRPRDAALDWTRTHVLAVDGGGSKTHAGLFAPDGTELARSRAGPCNLYRDADGGVAALLEAWRGCCGAGGPAPDAVVVSAGLAGLGAAGAADQVRAALAGFAQVHLSSDGYAALAGAFGAGPGVLVVAGTGVAGLARGADGRLRGASGWGFPAGDRGGGAWLGFALVQRWLERLDGYPGPESPLWSAAAGLAGTERPAILTWLRRADPADFAALAPAITAAGDALAEELLEEAAGHLVRLVRAIRPEGAPLAMSGGLAAALAPRVEAALGPVRLGACPLLGAWRIAQGEVIAELA